MSLSIHGSIVWINGTCPAGEYSDLSIFRKVLSKNLLENEIIVADGTYRNVNCVHNDRIDKNLSAIIRARPELNRGHEKIFGSGKINFVIIYRCMRTALLRLQI